MVKAVFIVFLVQLSYVSCHYQAKKIWLFSQTVYAGNVPMGRNGKLLSGHSEKVLCFVEIVKSQPMPEWQTAYFKGYKYSVNAVQLNEDSIAVGIKKNTKTTVTIKAGEGDKLFQLILTLKQADPDYKDAAFALEGMLDKKEVYIKSALPVVELAPQMMP